MKAIGIIGGMGPEATADLYLKITKLTPVRKDQDHIHIIIDSFAQIPDRTAAILSGGENPVPYMVKAAQLLEQAGAQALCMPCNTAHYFLTEVQKHTKLPFISIIDSAVEELKNIKNAKNVFVMATIGTNKSKVYETKLVEEGYNVLALPQDVQDDLMTCIYDGVKQGKTDDYLPLFHSVLTRLESLKPDAMFAACTEIPLLMEKSSSGVPVVDATLALAKNCVKFGMS